MQTFQDEALHVGVLVLFSRELTSSSCWNGELGPEGFDKKCTICGDELAELRSHVAHSVMQLSQVL